MLLVVVRAPELDPKKSQWQVMTPNGFQTFKSLVGMWALKLDSEENQWEAMTPSDL